MAFNLLEYSLSNCFNPFDVLKIDGCGKQCCYFIHNVTALDILGYHSYFNQMSTLAKQRWLLDYLNTHSFTISNNEVEISFFVSGKKVCQAIWISTIGISLSNFYKIRKKFLSGSVNILTKCQRSPLQKTTEAIAWMSNYFDLVGDHLPHRMIVHLPSSLSKVNIYHRMVSSFKARNSNGDMG